MQCRGLDRISYDVAVGIATYLWRSLIKEFLHLLIGTVPLRPSLFAIPPWYQVATPPSRSPTTTRRHEQVYAHFDYWQRGLGNNSCGGDACLTDYRCPTSGNHTYTLRFQPAIIKWFTNKKSVRNLTLVHLPFVNLIEMSGCASMILRKNVKMWGKSLAVSERKRNVTFFTAE